MGGRLEGGRELVDSVKKSGFGRGDYRMLVSAENKFCIFTKRRIRILMLLGSLPNVCLFLPNVGLFLPKVCKKEHIYRNMIFLPKV